jgi:hypothetical protein
MAADDYVRYLSEVTETTVNLMRLYGRRSKIQFRYVHDFIYGFDWSRWVRRDPTNRVGVKPFDLSFLTQSESRGRRILELIEMDDAAYPELDAGVSRNPFPFVREPEDELALYRDLSDQGMIPVPAWSIDAASDWNRDFDALRQSRARALGLTRNQEREDP